MKRPGHAALPCLLAAVAIGPGLALPARALAQELVKPAPRQGYYLGAGLRQGLYNLHSSDLGDLGFMTGGAFALRFGQMANELIGFGLVITSGGGANDDWTGGYGGLLLEAQLVPMDHLALRASLGIAGLSVKRKDEAQARDDDPTGTAGTLYNIGMSYDWFPLWEPGDGSGGFSLSVFLEAQVLPGDGLLSSGILMGLEANYWFGWNDNHLDLSDEEAYRK